MANKRGLVCQLVVLALITSLVPAKSQSSNVTFTLFATDMSGCDPNSACDLYVSILCSDGITEKWEACGLTSKRQDDNNPVWPEVITLEHTPGIDQYWKFELIDEDFMFDDFIAAIEVVVDDYVARSENLVPIPVPDNTGTFWIHRRR